MQSLVAPQYRHLGCGDELRAGSHALPIVGRLQRPADAGLQRVRRLHRRSRQCRRGLGAAAGDAVRERSHVVREAVPHAIRVVAPPRHRLSVPADQGFEWVWYAAEYLGCSS